ncbi:glycerol acyltransferase, partial [Streptomyces sp. SID2131]|nr:glycerol acyltransferase [Streptomyces sp. SID2131]
MADAKVIPFDDDRSRARRRPSRTDGEAAAVRALPGPQEPELPAARTAEEEPVTPA